MEIPDVIAINKMDSPAAKTMLNEVRSILGLDREREWRPPIVLTEAVRGEGVETLWERIAESERAPLSLTGADLRGSPGLGLTHGGPPYSDEAHRRIACIATLAKGKPLRRPQHA